MAIFASVVEQHSFSGAAEVLQMSKSNVSRRVALLEERLDMRLLHRTTRKMALTESGRVYYDHCARLVTAANNADNAIRAMHSRPSGILNVSLPETLGRACVLPLIPDFMRLYPEVQLNISISNRKVDFLEDRCDVAIRKGVIEDDTLCAVSLGSSTQYFYASPSYLADHPPLETPESLDQHHFLSSLIGFGPLSLNIRHGNQIYEKIVAPRLSVRDHEALLHMTIEGLGVALLPGWLTHNAVRHGMLVRVLSEFKGPSVDFNIVFQPHCGMAPNLRAFVEFIKERFKLHRPWEHNEIRNDITRLHVR